MLGKVSTNKKQIEIKIEDNKFEFNDQKEIISMLNNDQADFVSLLFQKGFMIADKRWSTMKTIHFIISSALSKQIKSNQQIEKNIFTINHVKKIYSVNFSFLLIWMLEKTNLLIESKCTQALIETIKIIKIWLEFNPSNLPLCLVNSFFSFIIDLPLKEEQQRNDIIKNIVDETVTLSIAFLQNHCEQCVEFGLFKAIITEMTELIYSNHAHRVTKSLLNLLNQQYFRQKFLNYIPLQKLFDFFFEVDVDNRQTRIKEDKQILIGKKKIIKSSDTLLFLLSQHGGGQLLCQTQLFKTNWLTLIKTALNLETESHHPVSDFLQKFQQTGSKRFKQSSFLLENIKDAKFQCLMEELNINSIQQLMKYSSYSKDKKRKTQIYNLPQKRRRNFVNYEVTIDSKNLLFELIQWKLQKDKKINFQILILNTLGCAQFFSRKELFKYFLNEIQTKKSPKQWPWESISFVLRDLIQFPPTESEKKLYLKVLSYLFRHYSFIRGQFSKQSWQTNNLQQIQAGQQLLQLIIQDPQLVERVNKNDDFNLETSFGLNRQLECALLDSLKRSFEDSPFQKTLQREFILWVGPISHCRQLYQQILCASSFFEILYEHISLPEAATIIATVLQTLDFSKPNMRKKSNDENTALLGPLQLLKRAVQFGSLPLQHFCATFIENNLINSLHFEIRNQCLYHLLTLLRIGFSVNQKMILLPTIYSQLFSICLNFQILKEVIKVLSVYKNHNLIHPMSIIQLLSRIPKQLLIIFSSCDDGVNLILSYFPNFFQITYSQWFLQKESFIYAQKLESHLNVTFYDAFSNNVPQSEFKKLYLITQQQFSAMKLFPFNILINGRQFFLEFEKKNKKIYLTLIFQNEFLIQNNIKISLLVGKMQINHCFNQQFPANFEIELNLNNAEKNYVQNQKLQNNFQSKIINSNNFIIIKHFPLILWFKRSNKCQLFSLKKVEYIIGKSGQNQQLKIHFMTAFSKSFKGCQKIREMKTIQIIKNNIFQNEQNSQNIVKDLAWSTVFFASSLQACKVLFQQRVLQAMEKAFNQSKNLRLRNTLSICSRLILKEFKNYGFQNANRQINLIYKREDNFKQKTAKQISKNKFNIQSAISLQQQSQLINVICRCIGTEDSEAILCKVKKHIFKEENRQQCVDLLSCISIKFPLLNHFIGWLEQSLQLGLQLKYPNFVFTFDNQAK